MKAITLWQPYAALVADGIKRYETRSWRTFYRGPIAIHAAARNMEEQDYTLKACWIRLGYIPRAWDGRIEWATRSAIIAVATLEACWATGLLKGEFNKVAGWPSAELAFGDFSPGRYAWELVKVRKLKRPWPCPGRQGLWNCRDIGEEELA